MEKWQKHFIDRNLVELTENIIPNGMFLAYLRQKRFLSLEEYINASSQLTPQIGGVRCTLEVLKTRIGAFYGLLHALRKTNQTKAVEILESSSLVAILESTLIVNGVQRKLKDCFPSLASFNIKKLLEETKIKEDFSSIFENGTGKLQILDHGIPEKYSSSSYVPRLISNRVRVKKKLFLVDCEDIFVFAGIRRHQLTNLVRSSSGTSISSEEIMNFKISAKYILLEDAEHWECLKENVDRNIPMHWINVENSLSEPEYVITASTGISKFVQQYLINTRHSVEASITEDTFVRNLAESQNSTGICICDEPGIGKSFLLANVARKLLEISKTMRVVCFVPIADYMAKSREEIKTDEEAIRGILSYSRSSPLSIEIVFFLIQESKLKMECFLDGLDELNKNQKDTANDLIISLDKWKNVRVIVTARPHMRVHLEDLLCTTAYDIIPFTTTKQKQYLTTHWKNKLAQKGVKCTSNHTERLKEFAKLTIQKIPSENCDLEESRLGIPLKLFLLAEVYELVALRYAKMPTVQLESITTTIHGVCVTNLFSKYLDIGLAKANNTSKEILIAEHTNIAIKLIFPHYTKTDGVMQQEEISESDLLAPGFLQKTTSGFEFFHRMFAEFLVAKHFAECFLKKKLNKFMIATFFTDFLRFQTEQRTEPTYLHLYPYQPDLPCVIPIEYVASRLTGGSDLKSYLFVHTTLLDFCNAMLESCPCDVLQTSTKGTPQEFFEVVGETMLFRILLASARRNLCHILSFVFRLIEGNSRLFTKASNIFLHEKDNGFLSCWQLLVSAAKYGGKAICEQATSFLLKTMKTKNIFEMMPEWMWTPLHEAVQKGDYKLTEFFTNFIPPKQRCILYYMLKLSIDNSLEVLRSKKEIMGMLVSQDKALLYESSIDKKVGKRCRYTGPLSVLWIHFELIKYMF